MAGLNATGPAPEKAAAAEKSEKSEKKDSDSGIGVWWIVGVFFIASVGAGFLISGRRKNQQR